MSSPLSAVPLERRRRAAWLAASLAASMVVIFVLAWVRPAPGVIRLFAAVALVGAGMLGLMTWGVVRSMRSDQVHAAVDAAIVATGAVTCDCGHEHDPDELHVTDAACAPEGASCDHSCATCLHAASVGPADHQAEGGIESTSRP
jgi:hypothetical protein